MSFEEFRLLPRDPGWKYEYFDGMAHITPRPRLATVRVAVEARAKDGCPLLDMLFVRPSWQRRGLATALVSWCLRELLAQGEAALRSRYLLTNEQSRAWHQRFGFTLEPDPEEAEGSARIRSSSTG
jgi:GNAT superfamily N-acetyltransferase